MAASIPGDPGEAAQRARQFASERLGPASARLLADPAEQALLLAAVRDGEELEDALLARVHKAARRFPALADELVAFFLTDLARLGHLQISSGLRRFLDTGDLVQSVLGDLWPDLLELHFRTRDQFLALLAARLRWKATDRARGLAAVRRREDLRVPIVDDEATPDRDARSPATEAGIREDWERIALVLTRMSERDRELLRRHLGGEGIAEIAAALKLQPATARKAVQRAFDRARRLAESG